MDETDSGLRCGPLDEVYWMRSSCVWMMGCRSGMDLQQTNTCFGPNMERRSNGVTSEGLTQAVIRSLQML